MSADYLAYGRHVLVDISEASPEVLNDADGLERSLVSAAKAEGVTVLGTLKKAFDPTGVTVLLLLAESHVSLHTYPEQGRAFFDAFTCGVQYMPANIFHTFAATTLPGRYKITELERGVALQEENAAADAHATPLLNRHSNLGRLPLHTPSGTARA